VILLPQTFDICLGVADLFLNRFAEALPEPDGEARDNNENDDVFHRGDPSIASPKLRKG